MTQPIDPMKNTMATSGMTIGIIGASLGLIPVVSIVALPLGIIGLSLSGIGFAKSRESGIGRGNAIAGIALNIAALALWGLWAVVWGSMMAEM